MALLIPNMKMPKCCNDCPCEYDSWCQAKEIVDKYGDVSHQDINCRYQSERESWCPLKEVPEDYTRAEDYTHALDSVTWYNGLAATVLKWKDLKSDNDYSIACPDNYCLDPPKMVNGIYTYPPSEYYMDKAQLQVLWMMAVEMFGDCGTSPRFGWIELKNIDAFHKWIDDITQVYRDSDEE